MFAGILCLAAISFGLVLLGAMQAKKNFERTDIAHLAYETHLSLTSNAYQLFKQFADAMLIGDLDRGAMEAELLAEIRKDVSRIREGITAGIRVSGLRGTEELENLSMIETKITKLLVEYQEVIDANPPQRGAQFDRLVRVLDERVDQEFARLVRDALDRQAGDLLYQRRLTREQLQFSESFAIAVAMGGMLLSMAAMIWLIRSFRRPVDQLIDGAEALARGDSDRRIRLDGGGELDGVAQALNRMADDIRQREEAMRQANSRLESAVASRTSELERLLASLRGSEASRRQLLGDISHELRAPLAEIRGEAEIALRGVDKPGAEYRQALARCLEASTRTTRLVDDLLFLARQEAGTARLQLSPVDLRGVVCEAVNMHLGTRPTGAVPIEVTRPDPAIVLRVDASAVCRALVLMLDHFDRSAARVARVELGRSSGWVSIVLIADDSSLSAKSLEYAFNSVSGSMVHDQATLESTGIGLPVARAIVEAHGGRIRVADGSNAGVTLTVEFPV